MNQVAAQVISNEKLWGEHHLPKHQAFCGAWLIRLHCPQVASAAKPGQFVMANCGPECLMPRPFSIHETDEEGNLALFYAVLENGRGTAWLSQRRAGDRVTLLGPLGNGFSIQTNANNLLLVAGGNGIAPLYFLAQAALRKKYSVTLLYGTADRKRYPISPQIKLVSATEDGSVGYQGKVTDLCPEHIDWADQVFACGPLNMYNVMHKKRGGLLKDKPAQISLEVRMGCGLGVCYACTVKTRNGLRQVCKDGPVFDLNDILWNALNYQ